MPENPIFHDADTTCRPSGSGATIDVTHDPAGPVGTMESSLRSCIPLATECTMVGIVLVIRDPRIRERFDAPLSPEIVERLGFHVERAASLPAAVPAERLDIAVRLLLLIDLVENCERPVATLCRLAGFPSPKDASALLSSYSLVGARALSTRSGRDRARARLLEVLLGTALPDRRRRPRRSDDQP